MARTGGIDNQTKQSLLQTADASQQLVKLNEETSKQTKWVIALTVIIAILTLIMAIPVIRDLFNYVSQNII